MAKWQLKYRVDWDATDGRNEGAQQTVWEILMPMEGFDGKAKEGEQGAVVLVLDLAKAFESQPPCGVGLGNALQLPQEGLPSVVRILRAPETSAVRRMCGGAAPDHHGHLGRVKVELPAFAHCTARCAE